MVNTYQELNKAGVNDQAAKHKKRELDLRMDCLINADQCTGLMCRRKVFDVCFDNEVADFDHLDCNPECILGCSCCLILQPMVCCDIHHPDHFSIYADEPSVMSHHSCLSKYTKKVPDLVLQDALDDWHEQKTISTYSWSHLNDLGPSLVLPNCMLDRIVNCAHHHKINSIFDLKKETGWMDSDRFGNEIITLIQRHAPPIASPFVTTPLSYPSTGNVPVLATPCPTARTNTPNLKHRNKCGACNNEGHNGKFQVLKFP
ncbi:uncharacterized protein BJ212DRAFT_1285275 [Suillus subaureus]|uniref:Uncharacterized protein n=1 Tax=Suillus subaureus TaxID=48587 RepID=A0A9P7DUG2_9AGAM|nr:uncharacterized protein BJ212DRAFT_1285275 [Suillus subaureus]KAG1803246.1 hypothetical protein BJ212DRAFT_1285275 [Suillus subaureus]